MECSGLPDRCYGILPPGVEGGSLRLDVLDVTGEIAENDLIPDAGSIQCSSDQPVVQWKVEAVGQDDARSQIIPGMPECSITSNMMCLQAGPSRCPRVLRRRSCDECNEHLPQPGIPA